MTNTPESKIIMTGSVYTRLMSFHKKGDKNIGHSHQYDHATLVASGSVVVRTKGQETIYKAPDLIWISKGIEHELEALEDNTICACIHALRDDNSEIIDPAMIPAGTVNDYSLFESFEPLIHK